MEIKDTDIVFVTTSLFTKWHFISESLVKKHFPGSEHIHIGGRVGWFDVWFRWIDRIRGRSEKYFVHIDEDCFLLSRKGVHDVIERMESEGSVIAGIPDANFHWRDYSSICVNPFFMVGKVKEITEASTKPYRHLTCTEDHIKDYTDKIVNDSNNTGYKPGPLRVSDYEPFYCFFYNLFNHGYRFTYLYPYDDFRFSNDEGKLPSTNVRVSSDGVDICIHMWYTRQWESPENLPRYTKLEKFINEQ
jgi:hypothetical protein